MPKQEHDDLTWPLVGKFLMQGGVLAIMWDHLYNGFVVAKTLNLFALFLGVSSGMMAFTMIGGEFKSNLRIVGFIISYVCLVVIIWKIGSFEFRKPPNQIIETIKELQWPFGKD